MEERRQASEMIFRCCSSETLFTFIICCQCFFSLAGVALKALLNGAGWEARLRYEQACVGAWNP